MMAYDRQFILAIMNDGSPVREINGKVVLPFHSEYKVRLKNKNNIRAKARVWIDGRKVSGLGDFILNPGETLDLERFLDESLSEGRCFKFVPLSDRRVNDPTDHSNGVIKVEFYREQVIKLDWNYMVPTVTIPNPGPYKGGPDWTFRDNTTTIGTGLGGGTSDRTYSSSSCVLGNAGIVNDVYELNPGQAGATVEGNISSQSFVEGDDFITNPYPITLTLKIQGPRNKTVTPHSAPKPRSYDRYCGTCGAQRRRSDKFCSRCGKQFPLKRKR
jgi:hypothetical protein